MEVAKLQNKIQDFAWGSSSYLPELLGYQNLEQKPQAELWMGVHPLGESHVEGLSSSPIPLTKYLSGEGAETSGGLGRITAAKYGNLPFLFKVLAAAQPLSIQAHPNKAQAREGFARENAAGIALNAAQRNYKDPNHKPEIALALTPFWAMCGFRPLQEIERNFALLGIDADFGLRFADHQSFFTSLMGLDARQKAALLDLALQTYKQSLETDNSLSAGNRPASSSAPGMIPGMIQWVLKLATFYPGDLGALAPLYLNLLHLQPRQAIYLPAGVLHAYLEGAAIELMANSDNVLRGGLTPKHQDLAELIENLAFEEFVPHLIEPQLLDARRSQYPTSAAEFRLECWQLQAQAQTKDASLWWPPEHPVMLPFVYKGCVEIGGVRLCRGESCIVPANSGEIRLKACGTEPAIIYAAVAKEI